MATDWLASISPFASLDDYTYGADITSPLSDVSSGSEPMSTYTNTGNGTGSFLDTSLQNQIFGGLSKVLDYALIRDAASHGISVTGQATTATQTQVVQRQQTNGMFLMLCALGAFLVLKS